jgi:DnaJ-class molecular chaperone
MSTTPPSSGDQPGNSSSADSPSSGPMAPGDEAPEGTPGTGETVCPACGGSGSVDGSTCTQCRGSGKINVGVGGA